MKKKMNPLSSLKKYLLASTKELEEQFEVGHGGWGFKDNGADILAVVHLDTVLDFRKSVQHNPLFETLPSGDILITSINLDDRLGLWLLVDYIPSLNLDIKYDILFTTDEEIGQSTAQYFYTKKEYKWVFQFDRKSFGTVVMYEYETRERIGLLEDEYQYDVQVGTFSDICYLSHLGCAGFNFGCGYINEHTNYCSARMSWINTAVRMFIDFYIGEKNTFHTYVPVAYHKPKTGAASGRYTFYDDRDDDTKWWDEVAEDIDKDSKKFALAKPDQSRLSLDDYCEWCGRVLLKDEYRICQMCLNDVGCEICKQCGTEFAIDDLNEEGFCYDCR